jgi:uncharacterized membrane protein YoaK (UPF0700 family)
LFSLFWHAVMHRLPGGAERHLRALLLIEALLLVGYLFVARSAEPLPGPMAPVTIAAILISAGAMSLQTLVTTNILRRNISTTAMTVNSLKMLSGFHDAVFDPGARVTIGEHAGTLLVILAFALGGFAGALSMTAWGFACLGAPVALLVLLALWIGAPD